jgi:hypothetical protein
MILYDCQTSREAQAVTKREAPSLIPECWNW